MTTCSKTGWCLPAASAWPAACMWRLTAIWGRRAPYGSTCGSGAEVGSGWERWWSRMSRLTASSSAIRAASSGIETRADNPAPAGGSGIEQMRAPTPAERLDVFLPGARQRLCGLPRQQRLLRRPVCQQPDEACRLPLLRIEAAQRLRNDQTRIDRHKTVSGRDEDVDAAAGLPGIDAGLRGEAHRHKANAGRLTRVQCGGQAAAI